MGEEKGIRDGVEESRGDPRLVFLLNAALSGWFAWVVVRGLDRIGAVALTVANAATIRLRSAFWTQTNAIRCSVRPLSRATIPYGGGVDMVVPSKNYRARAVSWPDRPGPIGDGCSAQRSLRVRHDPRLRVGVVLGDRAAVAARLGCEDADVF